MTFARRNLDEIESQLDDTVPYYVVPLLRDHREALDKIDELRHRLDAIRDGLIAAIGKGLEQ